MNKNIHRNLAKMYGQDEILKSIDNSEIEKGGPGSGRKGHTSHKVSSVGMTKEQHEYHSNHENNYSLNGVKTKEDAEKMASKHKEYLKEFDNDEVKTTMNNLDWGKTTAERNANLDKHESLKTEAEKEAFRKKLKNL